MPKRFFAAVLCLPLMSAFAGGPAAAAGAGASSPSSASGATPSAARREAAIARDAALPAGARASAVAVASPALVDAIARADAALFDAVFERCDATKVRALATDDLEFYHDGGGIVADSGDRFAEVIRHQCERRRSGEEADSRRELVPGTLEIYPVGEDGAIETGVHRFYERATGKRERLVGAARFLHVWRNAHGTWRVARIASYDHYDVEEQGR